MAVIDQAAGVLAEAAAPPLPWTERHEREVFIRLCELAIGFAKDDHFELATDVAWRAGWDNEAFVGEEPFRRALGSIALLDHARIDREVALVRQRAEISPLTQPERPKVLTRMSDDPVDLCRRLRVELGEDGLVDIADEQLTSTNPDRAEVEGVNDRVILSDAEARFVRDALCQMLGPEGT